MKTLINGPDQSLRHWKFLEIVTWELCWRLNSYLNYFLIIYLTRECLGFSSLSFLKLVLHHGLVAFLPATSKFLGGNQIVKCSKQFSFILCSFLSLLYLLSVLGLEKNNCLCSNNFNFHHSLISLQIHINCWLNIVICYMIDKFLPMKFINFLIFQLNHWENWSLNHTEHVQQWD